MSGQIQYGLARALTSAATRGSNAEAADTGPEGPDLAGRLRRFRKAVRQAGASASKDELEHLLLAARELNLKEQEVRDELAEVHVRIEELDLTDHIARHGAPVVPPLVALPAGESCHFVAAVRFGRRRNDQFGHLELTTSWLKFHGALDVSIVWSEVAGIERDDRDIRISLADSRRELRFGSHSRSEAVRGCAIARHLLDAARSRAGAPVHATL